jgi:hypothetical protein
MEQGSNSTARKRSLGQKMMSGCKICRLNKSWRWSYWGLIRKEILSCTVCTNRKTDRWIYVHTYCQRDGRTYLSWCVCTMYMYVRTYVRMDGQTYILYACTDVRTVCTYATLKWLLYNKLDFSLKIWEFSCFAKINKHFSRMYTPMYTYMYSTHTFTHTCTHTFTHTFTHTCTCTRTWTWKVRRLTH